MNELWQNRIKQYQASGLSISRWCREHGISVSSFRYHLYKKQPTSRQQFIELKSPSSGLVLHLGSAKLELAPDFDEFTLQRLLAIWGQTC